MSTTNNALEALFEGLDKGLLTEETKVKLATLINETVDARVAAKEKLLTEEVEALKTQVKTESDKVKADYEALTKKLTEETESNEKVLVEQAEKFKKSLEEAVIEETVKYKQHIEKQRDEDMAKRDAELQEITLAEAKSFKDKQDAALVEEVKNFKAELVEKVSSYLEAKLQESIPAEIMESAAKLAVYQPLVESVMKGFADNFVKLDTTSYKLIKEANDNIGKLEGEIQAKAKEIVTLKKEKREVERNVKVKSLTEGLTIQQKEKAIKLLESVELEDLEGHFAKVRDIIIESTVAKPATTAAQPKVEKLVESAKPTEPAKPAATPIADKAIVDHQVKKVLNEMEVKQIATGAKASSGPKTPDGANENIHKWASKVKPGYTETQK
jgi:hypothetical protein